MIKINVSQQLKGPIGSIRNYTVDEAVDITDGDIQVQGKMVLMRTDRGILTKGTLNTETELTCSRCLILFSCPLALNIEEEFFPTTDVITGASISLPDEPGSFTIDEHNILDLTEAIRQYALLAIPMKPLCQADCAGLCPTCGCNLNQVQCNCPTKPVDPRWSKLSKLALAHDQISVEEQKGTK